MGDGERIEDDEGERAADDAVEALRWLAATSRGQWELARPGIPPPDFLGNFTRGLDRTLADLEDSPEPAGVVFLECKLSEIGGVDARIAIYQRRVEGYLGDELVRVWGRDDAPGPGKGGD